MNTSSTAHRRRSRGESTATMLPPNVDLQQRAVGTCDLLPGNYVEACCVGTMALVILAIWPEVKFKRTVHLLRHKAVRSTRLDLEYLAPSRQTDICLHFEDENARHDTFACIICMVGDVHLQSTTVEVFGIHDQASVSLPLFSDSPFPLRNPDGEGARRKYSQAAEDRLSPSRGYLATTMLRASACCAYTRRHLRDRVNGSGQRPHARQPAVLRDRRGVAA